MRALAMMVLLAVLTVSAPIEVSEVEVCPLGALLVSRRSSHDCYASLHLFRPHLVPLLSTIYYGLKHTSQLRRVSFANSTSLLAQSQVTTATPYGIKPVTYRNSRIGFSDSGSSSLTSLRNGALQRNVRTADTNAFSGDGKSSANGRRVGNGAQGAVADGFLMIRHGSMGKSLGCFDAHGLLQGVVGNDRSACARASVALGMKTLFHPGQLVRNEEAPFPLLPIGAVAVKLPPTCFNLSLVLAHLPVHVTLWTGWTLTFRLVCANQGPMVRQWSR